MSGMFDSDPLARNTDPETSHLAAKSLNLELADKHLRLLTWMATHQPATDEAMSFAVIAAGDSDRHDQARRVVRTLRETHGMLVPAVGENGEVIRHRNSTDVWADCWVAK